MKEKDNLSVNIAKDKIFLAFVIIFSILSIVPLILILYYIFIRGLPVINWSFLTTISPSPQGEIEIAQEGLRVGGVANAIVGTLLIVLVGALIAIPFGIAVGIFLAEHKNSKIANITRVAVDMIQGIPSIIFGIVVSLWIVRTTKTFSGISGSVALALMMLPLVIKSTEETIKLIPNSIKEAGLALGTPYYRVVMRLIIPSGISGIVTGILMGVARIMGETAPLLFTSFGSRFLNTNLFKPMEALPTLIYKNSMSPNTNLIVNSWGASAILVIFVLVLNILTKMVVNKWKVKF
jgi:phosphate transport system permease protein